MFQWSGVEWPVSGVASGVASGVEWSDQWSCPWSGVEWSKVEWQDILGVSGGQFRPSPGRIMPLTLKQFMLTILLPPTDAVEAQGQRLGS